LIVVSPSWNSPPLPARPRRSFAHCSRPLPRVSPPTRELVRGSPSRATAPAAVFAPETRRASSRSTTPPRRTVRRPNSRDSDPWSIPATNVNALLRRRQGARRAVLARRDGGARRHALQRVTQADLLTIAEKIGQRAFRDTVSFYVVFVDGYFKEDDGRSRRTPRLSVRGTGVIECQASDALGFRVQPAGVHGAGPSCTSSVRGGPRRRRGPSDGSTRLHNGRTAPTRAASCTREPARRRDVDFVDTYVRPRNGVLFGPECIHDVRALSALVRATRLAAVELSAQAAVACAPRLRDTRALEGKRL